MLQHGLHALCSRTALPLMMRSVYTERQEQRSECTTLDDTACHGVISKYVRGVLLVHENKCGDRQAKDACLAACLSERCCPVVALRYHSVKPVLR